MRNEVEKDEIDDVTRLRDAANTLIKFFDEVIEVAEKYKVAGKADRDAEKEFDTMVDKINPTVEPYSEVHNILACKMGMGAFLNHKEMKAIRKRISDKTQELRRVLTECSPDT